MQVATYVDGRSIEYDDVVGQFSIAGIVVSRDQLLAYDRAAQLAWMSPEMRDWFYGATGATVAPAVSAPPVAKKRRKGLIIVLVVGMLFLCGGCGTVVVLGGLVRLGDEAADTSSPSSSETVDPAEAIVGSWRVAPVDGKVYDVGSYEFFEDGTYKMEFQGKTVPGDYELSSVFDKPLLILKPILLDEESYNIEFDGPDRLKMDGLLYDRVQ